jgi:glucokinase
VLPLPKWLLEEGDPLCLKTLNLFCSIFGAEAGNLALKMFTVGGVYVGGGIAPKILPKLKDGVFMRGFLDKGRYRSMLKEVPVNVILNPRVPLIGAAHFALSHLSH